MLRRVWIVLALLVAAAPVVAGAALALGPGYGRCSKCECRRFEGSGQCCSNCGHNYRAHY